MESELQSIHTIRLNTEYKNPKLTVGFPSIDTSLEELAPLKSRDGGFSELANDRRIDDLMHE